PVLPTLSPPLPPRWILFPEPPSLPSHPHAPVPDLGKLSGPPDRSKSVVKRALRRAMPNCLDAIIHTCCIATRRWDGGDVRRRAGIRKGHGNWYLQFQK